MSKVKRGGMVAVVGGRGVIGGAIVESLQAAGRDVVVVTHDERQAAMPGFRYGDLLRSRTLAPAVAGAEVVVQSATFPNYPIENPRRRHTFFDFDALGTERLVRAAREANASRYIYISGSGVPPNPEPAKPYFAAIRRGEQSVLESGLAGICVRPTLVYGPRDRGLNKIISAVRKLPVVPIVGDGRQMHQPVYVDDVAQVVLQAAELDGPQGVYEVGGPERITLDEMLRTALAQAGLRRPFVHIPVVLAKATATILERFPGPPVTRAAIDFIADDFIADVSALHSAFDVRLTPFEEGLHKYLASR